VYIGPARKRYRLSGSGEIGRLWSHPVSLGSAADGSSSEGDEELRERPELEAERVERDYCRGRVMLEKEKKRSRISSVLEDVDELSEDGDNNKTSTSLKTIGSSWTLRKVGLC
jgi:hypothetical protein